MTKSKLIWMVKQIFPVMYVSTYKQEDKKKLSIWRMWLGRCYNIRNYELAN